MIKTILFDLDGTLLNTIDDLADAANWVCTQHGWPTFSVETYKHFVGNGIPKLVERFSPENARTPEQLAATLAEFTARYDAHKEDKTAPYAGIPELLDTLRANGIQCAVFSNKADAFCGKIIDHYFGTGRFDAVRGSRPGVPTKPDPAGLYALMEQIHADPAATLFVGDSDVDILTGHNAHLPAMGALWGFRGRRADRRRSRRPGRRAGGYLGLYPGAEQVKTQGKRPLHSILCSGLLCMGRFGMVSASL